MSGIVVGMGGVFVGANVTIDELGTLAVYGYVAALQGHIAAANGFDLAPFQY